MRIPMAIVLAEEAVLIALLIFEMWRHFHLVRIERAKERMRYVRRGGQDGNK